MKSRTSALLVRALMALALLGFIGGGILLACVVLHFANTPKFEDYLTSRRAEREFATGHWPTAFILADGGTWKAGDIDPFALDPEDPELRIERMELTAILRHGDTLIAEVRQELAVAADRTSGDRRGLALRMEVLDQHDEVQVIARTWIGGEALLGPGSQGKGEVCFDVVVASGSGLSQFSVARLPEQPLPKLADDRFHIGLSQLLRHWLDPRGTIDERGLVCHMRHPASLSWRVRPDSSSSASCGLATSWMSIGEYSYSIEQRFKDGGGFSSSVTRSSTREFNGRVW